ncbi:tape measure protein [Lacunimicrobium album]
MGKILDIYSTVFVASTSGLEKGCRAAVGGLNKVDYAATKALQNLQNQVATFGKAGHELELLTLKQKGTAQAIIDATEATHKQLNAMKAHQAAVEADAAAQQRAANAIKAVNDAGKQLAATLNHQINTFHMSEAEAEHYTHSLQGMARATRDEIAAARQQLTSMKAAQKAQEDLARSADRAEKELKQEADAWRRLTQTPIEKYAQQLKRLYSMRQSGAIDNSTYGRGRSMLEQELKAAQDAAKKSASASSSAFGGLLTTLAKVAGAVYLVRVAFDTLKSVVGTPLKLAAEFEKTHVAMKTLLGSATLATGLLKEWEDYAAVSPFSSDTINQSGRQLLAFGYNVGEVTGSIKQMGDMAAGSGANLQSLSFIFGQGRAAGKWLSKDLYQLANLGIPAVQELVKILGVDGPAAVYKFVEAGKLTDQHMMQLLENMTSQGGLYYNATMEQGKTMSGMWEQLGDQVGLTLKAIGAEMIKAWDLKNATKSVTEFVEMLRNEYMPTVAAIINQAGQMVQFWKDFAASMNDSSSTIGQVTGWISYLNNLLNDLSAWVPSIWIRDWLMGTFNAGFQDELEKQEAHRRAAMEQEKQAAEQVAQAQQQAKVLMEQQTEATNEAAEAMKRFGDAAKQAFDSTRTPQEKLMQQLEDLEETYAANRATEANPNGMTADTYNREKKRIKNEYMGYDDPTIGYQQGMSQIEMQRDNGLISDDEFNMKQGELKSKFLGVDFDKEGLKTRIGMQKLRENFEKGLISKEEMEQSGIALMPQIMKKAIDEARTPMQKFQEEWKKFESAYGGSFTPAQMNLAKAQMQKDILGDDKKKDKPMQFANFALMGSNEAHQAALRNNYGFGSKDPQKELVKETKKQTEELKKLNKNIEQNTNKGYQPIF